MQENQRNNETLLENPMATIGNRNREAPQRNGQNDQRAHSTTNEDTIQVQNDERNPPAGVRQNNMNNHNQNSDIDDNYDADERNEDPLEEPKIPEEIVVYRPELPEEQQRLND